MKTKILIELLKLIWQICIKNKDKIKKYWQEWKEAILIYIIVVCIFMIVLFGFLYVFELLTYFL